MAQRSSLFLALLFAVNPFMLLLFQNCSVFPQASNNPPKQVEKQNRSAAMENSLIGPNKSF
ncbi:MAG: hypothetical protein A2622_03835 [Bdellovibrionales bacterium RIFCSPHIGHO2_01_FULL_40_29]|nr:MAG: hypothetical protein A2622_03835 [Bdellovibrionales bacterium RIFCSPHIGHO2_01_FULL_40_29]OFZ35352.1 MAG: hypothetical protein A3D17_08195 [Bdellovibrionales bacterium RIFCSPHIGHO2_02_FULL_40_15]